MQSTPEQPVNLTARMPFERYQALYGAVNRLDVHLAICSTESDHDTTVPAIPEAFFVPLHSGADFPSPSEVMRLCSNMSHSGRGFHQAPSLSLFVKFDPTGVVDEALSLLAVNSLDAAFPARSATASVSSKSQALSTCLMRKARP
jgi:hypothetical protein